MPRLRLGTVLKNFSELRIDIGLWICYKRCPLGSKWQIDK
jgi:hypothetical protein